MGLTEHAIQARREIRARQASKAVMNRADCIWLLSVLSDAQCWSSAALQQETRFDAHHIGNAMQLLLGYGFVTAQDDGFSINDRGTALLAELARPAERSR